MPTLTLKPGPNQLIPGAVYDSIVGLVGPYSALPDNCSLIGDPKNPTTISYASNQGYAFKSVSAAQQFTGVNYTRGGLFLEGAGCKAVKVDGNIFSQSVQSGPKRCGLQFSGSADTATVTNNLFNGGNGNFGLYADAGGTNIVIANNEYRDTRAGAHWAGTFNNLLVEQNYFVGIVAQALELQGGGSGIVVQDNWVEWHKLAASGNNDAYSYSLPLQDSSSTRIERNVSIQKKSNEEMDKVGVRIIFEIGGKNVLMQNNYSDGGNHVIAGNGLNGTGAATGNCLKNYRQAPGNTNGNTTIYSNNGDAIKNVPDLLVRGRPQRFVRFGATLPQNIPPVITPPVSSGADYLLHVAPDGTPTIKRITGGTLPGTL